MSDIKLIKLGAVYCQPCKVLDPILEQLSKEFTNVEFELLDIEKDEKGKQLVDEFGIMGVPHMFIYKGDKQVESINGFKTGEFITEKLKQYL